MRGMAAGNIDDVAAILESSINGSSKKGLQSETGLALELLNRHLPLLESKNLVRILRDKDGKHETIKITERGTRFLEIYQAMREKYLSIATSN